MHYIFIYYTFCELHFIHDKFFSLHVIHYTFYTILIVYLHYILIFHTLWVSCIAHFHTLFTNIHTVCFWIHCTLFLFIFNTLIHYTLYILYNYAFCLCITYRCIYTLATHFLRYIFSLCTTHFYAGTRVYAGGKRVYV